MAQSLLGERKSFIKAFAKEIVVTGDKVLLKHTILYRKIIRSKRVLRFTILYVVVGKRGLEPLRLSAHDPKSCSSANSDTPP
jgi:hypothetical protein